MFNKLESALRATIRKRRWFHRQQWHKLQAESALKVIEAEQGKLDPRYGKLAEEYARDILGWIGFAPWLKMYSALAKKFKEGWIPFNYYTEIVSPGAMSFISREKTLSSKLMNTDRFPDVAYYVGKIFFTTMWEVLPTEDVEKYIFSKSDRIVFKQSNSGGGNGIQIFTRETFNIEKVRKAGNGVFQKYIRQHNFFEEIMPNSVATLRLNSVIENSGKISCRAACLKIGRNNDPYVRPPFTIIIPVDLASGKLNEKGYYRDWRSLSQHPDTGVVFGGKVIPKFNECVACVLRTHQAIPYCRVIGWDITVDKNEEVQFMEWEEPHIAIAEATQGPCFADMGWEKLRPVHINQSIIGLN